MVLTSPMKSISALTVSAHHSLVAQKVLITTEDLSSAHLVQVCAESGFNASYFTTYVTCTLILPFDLKFAPAVLYIK